MFVSTIAVITILIPVCLSVCLSISLPACPLVWIIWLCPSVRAPVCPSVYLSVCLSASVCLFISLSFCLSVCLSVWFCLSTSLSFWLSDVSVYIIMTNINAIKEYVKDSNCTCVTRLKLIYSKSAAGCPVLSSCSGTGIDIDRKKTNRVPVVNDNDGILMIDEDVLDRTAPAVYLYLSSCYLE